MAEIAGDTDVQSEALEDLVDAVNYRQWLCSLGTPYFGDPGDAGAGGVLEIGSGLGHYAADWADAGVPLTATEADPSRLAVLRDRFADDPRVSVRELSVPITQTGEYSAVVAYNVLEHIADDVTALGQFAGLLHPGGAVVLVVPAFEFAMSRFDREIGHQRRYTVSRLRHTAERAGLRVEVCRYVNGPGLLAWFVMCRLLRGRPRAGRLLALYDRFYVPAERWLERRVRVPFGQSVFLVARTPA